jgi:hypothetical protein
MGIIAAVVIGLFLVVAVWVLWRRRPSAGDRYESGAGMQGTEPGHGGDYG